MEHKNIWESNLNDKCQYINNIDEFLKFLEDNNRYDFIISEKHMPNDKSQFILDEISNKKNICITYTNNEHNVTVFTLSQFQQTIIVNPTFFEAYKDKITEYIKNKINTLLTEKQYYIKIPDFLIDDNLINELINNKNLENITIKFFNITEKDLTAEQIKKLKSKHLEVYYDGNKISTNKLIDYYTLKDLQKIKTISISQTLTNEEIENFIYINDDTIITIKTEYSASRFNEQEYLNNLIRICNILKTHNKKYNLKIDINNRELLKQSGILNTPNINFTINNDLYEYKQEEYLKEEEQLDKLIEPIKNSNLSPYEKYLAVYNIVKQFKPYKENNENKEESRYLRYILNNEYIVCVGFSKLLTTLLDKAGIPAMNISVGVDTSYDDGFTMEDKPTNIEGHQRNIIKIDDDKYNIHGIFIADPTWDNSKEYDLYQNSAMTFDRKKEAKRLETLNDYDLLLDFHNFEEFTKKLNFFLKKQVRNPFRKEKPYQEKLINAYKQAYSKIMEILSKLDYPKFLEFHNKYNDKLDKYDITLKEIEDICSDFLTEYATYILPLSNQKIDKSTLLEAAVNARQSINDKNKEKEEIKKEIESINNQVAEFKFPYTYNPNETRDNYLESANTSKKR